MSSFWGSRTRSCSLRKKTTSSKFCKCVPMWPQFPTYFCQVVFQDLYRFVGLCKFPCHPMTITCLWCWVNAHQCRHDQWVQLGANDRASVDAVWSHLFHCFQHGWFLTWPNFRLDCRHNDQKASHFTQHGPRLKETTEMVLESIYCKPSRLPKRRCLAAVHATWVFGYNIRKYILKGKRRNEEWNDKTKKKKRGGK